MSLLGTTIGRIRLIELAGKGGMGEVFVGYDETLGRKVAVKCVSPDYRFNRRVAGRILREARILSRLAHPNICQLYDLIQEDEGDYLVLELVEGEDLKDAMGRGLDFKTKLRIAQQIVDVLVAAHAEGVIHRDLKPDNIMLTHEGEIKVLDFGIARSLRKGGYQPPDTTDPGGSLPTTDGGTLIETRTQGENMMGTPRYMSPEQVRAEPVTTASDMYSFGLLLQELLTEKSPYKRRQALPNLLMEVAAGRSRPVEGQDAPLTKLINELKSLDPNQRPTAKDAARRLRWIRRSSVRRMQQAVAVGVALLVTAAAAKYTFDLQREREAAVAARLQAEDLVAYMIDDLAEELELVGRLDILGQVARKALDHFEAFPQEGGHAALLRGQAFHNVAEVLDYQGDLEAALDACDTALRIHMDLLTRDFGNVERRVAAAEAHLLRGNLLTQLGDSEAAEVASSEGLRLAQQGLEQHPDSDPLKEVLAEAHYSLGLHLLFIDVDRSAPYFLRGIELYQALANAHPDKDLYRYRLAVLYGQGMGQIHLHRGDHEASYAAIRKAYTIYEDLLAGATFNSKWLHGFAWENRRLGEYHFNRGEWDDAFTSFDAARRLTEQLLLFEPAHGRWRIGLAADYISIAKVQARNGQLDEAAITYRRGLRLSTQMMGIEPNNSEVIYWQALGLIGLGVVLDQDGQAESARDAWQQAVDVTLPFAEDLERDLFIFEAHIIALLHLGRVDVARVHVESLRQRDWFDGAADPELVRLGRRAGLLPADESVPTSF